MRSAAFDCHVVLLWISNFSSLRKYSTRTHSYTVHFKTSTIYKESEKDEKTEMGAQVMIMSW